MSKKYDIDSLRNTVIEGNCLDKLKLLPDNSVDCCVTSPPYYGLRDYGHKGQIGLEQTPETYVSKLVEVFEQVKRVLKPTGTLWLNLGDSYAAASRNRTSDQASKGSTLTGSKKRQEKTLQQISKISGSFKPKDLIGIPWMVAQALRDAGWYLRSSIIWDKPNPMPSSATDRPTMSHEYIFLLSKSKSYYYDSDAIRTPPTENTLLRINQQIESQKGSNRAVGFTNGAMKSVGPGRIIRKGVDSRGGNQGSESGIAALPIKKRGAEKPHMGYLLSSAASKEEQMIDGANKKTVWRHDDPYATWKWFYENFPEELVDPLFQQFCNDALEKDDVWNISTKPFKEAHFATYPADLIIDCIKAGTSNFGCCSICGNPYTRVTEPLFDVKHTGSTESQYEEGSNANRLALLRQAARDQGVEYTNQKVTIGWEPTCKCHEKSGTKATVKPAIVLDPFDGAGTTRLQARRLGRDAIGIELNPEYIEISTNRIKQEFGLFA